MARAEPADRAAVTAVVDAAAPGLGPADFAIVFGTQFPDPVPLAAGIVLAGLAPAVVLTGGANRHNPRHVEADVHAGLLSAAGVPAAAVIVERRSASTFENVLFARPLIEETLGEPSSAIAVVKWHHRRAVLILARQMPSLRRIFTVTYEPPDLITGRRVTRENWPQADAEGRVRREYAVIRRLIRDGTVDDLAASGHGWTRLPAARA
ncbi:MAG TPA: YdcF family protein [Streptosporangiaceae bacterium]|nr:YdcF family protein [Streptosporangiaceae bacterium]